MLVGISGIDGSGKSYIAKQLLERLRQKDLNAISISVDGWLNLPHIRFNAADPASHFYQHAIRFDEMFHELVLPLSDSRACRLEADFATETGLEFQKYVYEFRDVDVIVLEGIFLFKMDYVQHFDLRIWIECSFETALARAVARQQEQLSPSETIRAYETIYFPAQRLHFQHDAPQKSADVVLVNDISSTLLV